MVRTTLVALAVLSLPLAGCATDGESSGGSSLAGQVGNSLMEQIKGEWNLSKLGNLSVDQILRQPGVQSAPTLSIADDGKVGGFAGVNRYFGNLDLGQIAQGKFPLGPTGSTKMAGSPNAMKLEDQFLSALSKVKSFDPANLADGVLSLLGENGQELLRFVRAG